MASTLYALENIRHGMSVCEGGHVTLFQLQMLQPSPTDIGVGNAAVLLV
jgi:hypothetical protein